MVEENKEIKLADGRFVYRAQTDQNGSASSPRSGGYGEVLRGYYDKETKKEVVIKRDLKKKEALVNEIRLYDAMKYTPGFPKMLWYGEDGDRYFMALEKLDYSLGTCFKECGEKFSEKTIFMLADQLIQRIEALHSRFWLHLDIKPDNIMISKDDRETVYLIDFGMSEPYRRLEGRNQGVHIPLKYGVPSRGTPPYISMRFSMGIQPSRRDDLESLGFMLIEFSKGKLPWHGLGDKYDSKGKIAESKASTSLEKLCERMSPIFLSYMKQVRNLQFEQKPNYKYLRQLFMDEYRKEYGEKYDLKFDWKEKDLEKQEEGKIASPPESQDSSY